MPTDSSGPAPFAADTNVTPAIDAGLITDGPTVAGPTETLGGRDSPAVGDTAPPAPLVVARLVAGTASGSMRRSDPISSGTAEIPANQAAGVGSRAATPAPAPSPAPGTVVSTSAPPASTTPLTVPVQRSAAAPPTGPTHQVGDVVSAATQRPISTTDATPSLDRSAAADLPPSTGFENVAAVEHDVAPSSPNPASVADLVVARSAVESADQRPDQTTPPALEVPVTGLLADRAPLVESSPLDPPGPSSPAEALPGDRAPLTVTSSTTSSQGFGPTLQRRFADPATSVPSTPNQASLLPSVPVTGSASPPGAVPDVAGTTVSSRVLDEQGYPPLIARPVQRRAVDAEAVRPNVTSASWPSADLDPAASPPQAPLSGFSAAISALHDPASPTGHDSALVVARRLSPDHTGRLPAPQAQLQRTGTTAEQRSPLAGTMQRSLIAGLSPVGSSTSTASRAATTTAPAVQRLRYEDVTGPSEGRLGVEHPAGPAEPWIETGEPRVVAPSMPTASSSGWSSVGPAASPVDGGWSSSAAAGTPGSSAPAAPLTVLQRSATGTAWRHAATGTSQPAAGTPTYPRIGEPSASSVSPDVPSSDPPPMIQRRFDAPAPSASVTPPSSADQPTMAVSGRSVGLAEMFAMAAAQSTAEEATVQRSPETEVQRTSFDSGPSDAGPTGSTGLAAPPPPATAARPPSGAELEEMARRLYEPLSARLRAELWQDRERSGLLTDLRP